MCGKAWSALPSLESETLELMAPIDLLLRALLDMFQSVSSGLVVASSDVLLYAPPGARFAWPQTGATGLAIPADQAYGPHHGVYLVQPDDRPSSPSGSMASATDGSTGAALGSGSAESAVGVTLTSLGLDRAESDGSPPEPPALAGGDADSVSGTGAAHSPFVPVDRFFQKASIPELRAAGAVRSDGQVLVDTGVVYFSRPAALKLLALARGAPISACTYLALDMRVPPLRVELYSDVMLAMGGGLGASEEEY